jgi:myo-inositol 2-dehydrogenase/D-chiro-inositol 1-dehydrogenase
VIGERRELDPKAESRGQMEEVRIGFIGCGGNASGHMRRLGQLEGARIVGVCDVVPEMAQKAAALTGGEAYTDHRALLDREDLQAVYLSIPVFAHGPPELDTMARGLPFFVEKPVARDMATAHQIEAEVTRRGALTCVGYQLRYLGSTDVARETLAGSAVGLAVGKYWSGSGRGDANRWVRQFARSGGQLVEQATHTLDMMRFLIGEVKSVYARQASRTLHDIDCPDVHAVVLEFESGALGSLTTTWAYDPRDWSHANVVDVTFGQSLLHWSASAAEITADGVTTEHKRPDRSIDELFVDAVRRGDRSTILSPYADAIKSLAVSLAALQSAVEDRAVAPGSL